MNGDQTAEPIIGLDQVTIHFKDKLVLQDVSLSIQRGEFVYIIGRTGSGKSSLLRLLYADLSPSHGTVRVDGHAVETLPEKEVPFLRRKLGIVFQDFQLLPDRTVGENIAFAMRATGWKDSAAIKNKLTEVLMQVGLSAKINSRPHQLSGGEQQRTVIARALVNDPLVLIADEPTGNLDPEVTQHIMDILHRINRGGTSVLMATHEHELILRYPARVLECKDSRLLDRGRGVSR